MEEDNDELSLVPEYKFEWSNGNVRETTDPDFTNSPHEPHPDAIELLAQLGREDPECEVTLIGMSA